MSHIDKLIDDLDLDRTGHAALPGLEISIKLPPKTYLYNAGAVENLLRFNTEFELRVRGTIRENRTLLDRILNRLESMVALDAMSEKFPHFDGDVGRCFEHVLSSPRGGRIFTIAKLKGLEPNLSIFADGHESGEFIQNNRLGNVMQEAVDAAGVKIDVTKYQGEDFADMGGFVALLKAQKARDTLIRSPLFKTNPEGRREMARIFGLA